MDKRGNNKGQITIFIIIAIVILAILVILFYPRIKKLVVPSTPSIQLRDCLGERLKKAIDLVSERGGSIKPVNAVMYEGKKIEYLCYTNEYYQTCSNQQPLLKQHIEREIYEYVKPQVSKCMNKLKEDLRKQGYSVTQDREDISVNIVPDNIEVEVSGLTIEKEGEAGRYDKLKVDYGSELYTLIMLASSILNWEARYGDSDITTYMLYYPNIKAEKYKQGDGSKIYILTAKDTEDRFMFATRSLSWPAGYGFGETHTPNIF
jgi:hypothetical protein